MEDFVEMGNFFESEEGCTDYRSLREYSRVEAFLPVRIRRVLGEELQAARSRVVIESALTEHPEMPQLEDEKLSACLQILNSKLDSIIRMLVLSTGGHTELDFAKVSISAGGLGLLFGEAYEVDDFVEIRLVLPTSPFMIFYIYGNVVKCEPVCQKYELGVEFIEIDDDIREHIAKYVFHRQREILRKKRSQGS
jgi:hypothetical protein